VSDLQRILADAGIRIALVVDDAYDEVPRPADLSQDAEEWTTFFADAVPEDRTKMSALYPPFETTRADELPSSEEFVAALWNGRTTLRPELVEPLFARYIQDTASDKAYLGALLQQLQELGLTCETAGRDFLEKASDADLIIIDLYLGSTQDDADMQGSARGLAAVTAERIVRPPLVVLMSRSSRLQDKRTEFRDSTGLFESAFRVVKKNDLARPGHLHRILARLATHFGDSLRLAGFLNAWSNGVDKARQRTVNLIRTLDLTDHAQIRELVLSAEGEPTGSYLVDVFDRVLLHETERESAIIDTAIELSVLNSDKYPPPYVAGSRDLQNIVHRSLFQNRERLRLPGSVDSPVAFGDLLRSGSSCDPSNPSSLVKIEPNRVWVVMTAACDLQRRATQKVLFVVGTFRPLSAAEWSYDPQPVRTPVCESPEGERFWIRWDLKHVETVGFEDLQASLNSGRAEKFARLRENHALELQQKLLAGLGRIGLAVPMPGTFPMRVELWLLDAEKKAIRLDVPVLREVGGVCYVGRDSSMRLILCEEACEGICKAIDAADLTTEFGGARLATTYLRDSEDLILTLERGIALPSAAATTPKEIMSPTGAIGSGTRVRTIGLIIRNPDASKVQWTNAQANAAGFIVAVWDSDLALADPAKGH
jgi:hypothetical protein